MHAPHYSLKDLRALDERIDAHWDGLRIAGQTGLNLCLEQLTKTDPGTFFAAALVAQEQNPELLFELAAWAAVEPSLARPLVAALCWQGAKAAQPVATELMASSDESARYLGLSTAACLRLPVGPFLENGLRDASPLVRARALRAAGEYGRVELWRAIVGALADAEPLCRYWAAWSACILGQQAGVEVLQDLALRHGLMPERAVEAASLCMSADAALAWQRELAEKGHARLALICARTAPTPGCIPFLFQHLEIPEHARLAGEAFTFLSGLDLSQRALEGAAPPDFEAGPSDDPTDEQVSMDPDEDLPWPDPGKLKKEWQKLESRFTAPTRYLLGRPLAPAALQDILRTGKQRQRRVAALALRRLGQPLFETRALASLQQQELGGDPRAA